MPRATSKPKITRSRDVSFLTGGALAYGDMDSGSFVHLNLQIIRKSHKVFLDNFFSN